MRRPLRRERAGRSKRWMKAGVRGVQCVMGRSGDAQDSGDVGCEGSASEAIWRVPGSAYCHYTIRGTSGDLSAVWVGTPPSVSQYIKTLQEEKHALWARVRVARSPHAYPCDHVVCSDEVPPSLA